DADTSMARHLTIAPRRCHMPDALAGGRRLFGLSAQLYGLVRDGDQGIGDFTTLARFGGLAARAGAALVGVQPLHALFPGDRDRASPYQPSDRRFIDPIHLDIGPAGQAAASVDYPAVWAARRAALEAAFAAFGGDGDFEAFVRRG